MVQRLHDFEEKAFYEYDRDLQLAEKEKMEEKVNYTTNKYVAKKCFFNIWSKKNVLFSS